VAVKNRKSRRTHSPSVGISDVATAAGVSTASVSRYMQNPNRVSSGVRERVETAIRELNYIPHRAGRALASRKSLIVGAIVPTLENAIFSRQVMAFQKKLRDSGYTLLLATSEYDAELEFTQARVMLEHGVDALMLVGQKRNNEFYEMIERAEIPFITTWIYNKNSTYPCCGFSHEIAMKDLIDYVVGLGHQNIGVITGFSDANDRVFARLKGIKKALKKYKIELDRKNIMYCNYTFEAGGEALARFQENDRLPTAILCGNDILAVGVLTEARKRNIKVPEDLSVMGFGDLDIASQVDPPLSTVRTPKAEIGEAAATYLLDTLSGRKTESRVEVSFKFCFRESFGRASK